MEKVALVTGANTGIGWETALSLAQSGYRVVLACRNQKRADAACAAIKEQVPSASLHTVIVDLADFDSVHRAADTVIKMCPHLNLLINNAGVMVFKNTYTKNGFETQFAVNHLGHFLLTARLIPHMPDQTCTRIVSVSSIAHRRARMRFEDIHFKQSPVTNAAYAQSKLANLLFSHALDARLKKRGKQLRAVCAHPGVSETPLFRHMPTWLAIFMKCTVVPFFTHSADKAAAPLLMAALTSELKGGEYFGPTGIMECKGPAGPAWQAPQARDTQAQDCLWSLSESLTQCTFPI